MTTKATAGRTVLDHLRRQVTRMRTEQARVRRDEPDSVHSFRVATRRLRSALQTFGTVVDRPATRPVTEELRWLAGVLGDARDLEVLRERLERRIDETPDELVLGPVRARVTGHFAREQAQARERLIEALDSDRYRALLDRLDALLADPPFTEAAARPAREVLGGRVRRSRRRVERRLATARSTEPGRDRDVALHEARKAAKRARYAGELSAPVLGRPAKKFAKAMEAVQDDLGAHQDSVVTRGALRELGAQAYLAGENGFTFGLLHGDERATADAVERRLGTLRGRVRKAKRPLC